MGSLFAKIARPTVSDVLQRGRLFKLLDSGRRRAVVWISGPPGSGKTTLASSYVESRKLPCLWYQMDEGDSDLATFFYYMGLAGKNAAPALDLCGFPCLPSVVLRNVLPFLYGGRQGKDLIPPCSDGKGLTEILLGVHFHHFLLENSQITLSKASVKNNAVVAFRRTNTGEVLCSLILVEFQCTDIIFVRRL